MKSAIIMGTRPEIIKLYPIVNQLKDSFLILTGQHYDYNLSLQFIEDLGIRKPDFSLNLKNRNPAIQTGELIMKLSQIFSKVKMDTVIVQGDTNTALAASMASLKTGIPVSHVESGLRSFDWRMPEEHNRIAIDHISELLFAPTQATKKNLTIENVHGKIFVTGNTVIDSINKFATLSTKKTNLSINHKTFVLMTLHRSENVDNKGILAGIVKAVLNSKENFVFPVHPRTFKRLHEFNLYKKLEESKNVQMLKAVGYFDIMELMKKCLFILTDSGGIQEEATSPKIRKKVLVVRRTTDRPEAVLAGLSDLVGTNSRRILSAIRRASKNPSIGKKKTPYGKGDAGRKIVDIIQRTF